MDFGNVLPTIIENFTRMVPIRIVHSYEQGVKFRFGKDIALLKTGVHLFVPFFESIEIDPVATRYTLTPLQDLVTKEGVQISLSSSFSYSTSDFRKLWVKLQDREDSVMNLTQRLIAEHVPEYTYDEIRTQTRTTNGFQNTGDKKMSFPNRVFHRLEEECAPYGIQAEGFGIVTLTRPRQLRLISENLAYRQIHG